MLRLLFFILGACVLLGASTHAGGPLIVVDFASFLLVFLCALFFALATHGPRTMLEAFVAGCFGDDLAEGKTAHHRVVLVSFRRLIYASAAIGYLMGLVGMLANLSDPSVIGPAIAVALLTSLYAVLLGEFLVSPMIARLTLSDGGEASGDGPKGTMADGNSARGAAILGVIVLSHSAMMLLVLMAANAV